MSKYISVAEIETQLNNLHNFASIIFQYLGLVTHCAQILQSNHDKLYYLSYFFHLIIYLFIQSSFLNFEIF